jgi:hypothetical protein
MARAHAMAQVLPTQPHENSLELLMTDQQSAQRSPTMDVGVPNAMVEMPDLGRAGATDLFRARNTLGVRSSSGANDGRLDGSAETRQRFGLAKLLSAPHHRIAQLLDLAGVRIGGAAPWDMQVHDSRVHARIVAHGSLGLGEAYMDGWWDAEDLDGYLYRVLAARLDQRVGGIHDAALYLQAKLINLQQGLRARGRRAPLRSRQRLVPGNARQAHGLQLRLLEN